MADLDRLLREQNPEPGQPRIPVPQYQKVGGLGYEKVTGQHGGAHAVLLGPDGQPINSGNRLPVDTGLTNNLQIIADNQGRLYGRTAAGSWLPVKVNGDGQLELAQSVVIDNVTVNVGAEVKVNNTPEDPVNVQLSGTNTVLLSGFYDRDEHWTSWHSYYWGKEGINGGYGNVPLDVRSYREIAVRITSDLKRQGVEQTIKYAVYAYTDLISKQDSEHAVDILVPETELAYGATVYLTADKYPKLADPHLGILVHTVRTTFQANDEGGTTVEIIGRV